MGHYPAIDVLNSVSRLAPKISSDAERATAQQVREALAAYSGSEDLIQLGAYVAGSNPKLDSSIHCMPSIEQFLRQEAGRSVAFSETASHLERLSQALQAPPPAEARREPVRKA